MSRSEPADRRRWWRAVPPLAVYAADIALTLQGQPPGVWRGDPAAVVEANPLGHWLLVQSPWVFLGVAVAWGAAFAAVIGCWRHRAADALALGLTVGHAFGAASWMIRFGVVGLMAAAGTFYAADRLWAACRTRAGCGEGGAGG